MSKKSEPEKNKSLFLSQKLEKIDKL